MTFSSNAVESAAEGFDPSCLSRYRRLAACKSCSLRKWRIRSRSEGDFENRPPRMLGSSSVSALQTFLKISNPCGNEIKIKSIRGVYQSSHQSDCVRFCELLSEAEDCVD